jgi:hypothetical protein
LIFKVNAAIAALACHRSEGRELEAFENGAQFTEMCRASKYRA